MKKNKLFTFAAIIAVIMIIYSVVVLLIGRTTPRGLDKCYLLAYFMMLLAFLLVIGANFLGAKNNNLPNVNFILVSASVYAILMFIFTTILYFFDYQDSITLVIIIWVILFGLLIIGVLLGLRQRYLASSTTQARIAFTCASELSTYLKTLKQKTTDQPLLKKINEVIALVDLYPEKEISEKITETTKYLTNSINHDDFDNAIRHLDKIQSLFGE